LHIVTQIRAALSIFGLHGAGSEERFENAAAHSANTAAEDLAENVERIVETASKSSALLKRCVTEAIVSRTFLGIHQCVIRFAQFLEFFFRMRIVRVLIGVILHCQLPVSALDLVTGSIPIDAEHFVIIAFLRCHC